MLSGTWMSMKLHDSPSDFWQGVLVQTNMLTSLARRRRVVRKEDSESVHIWFFLLKHLNRAGTWANNRLVSQVFILIKTFSIFKLIFVLSAGSTLQSPVWSEQPKEPSRSVELPSQKTYLLLFQSTLCTMTQSCGRSQRSSNLRGSVSF